MAWDDTQYLGDQFTHIMYNDLVTYIKNYVSTISKGAATISAGNTFVDVAHGLGSAPSHVDVTPQELEGSNWYVDTIGATTFRINIGYAQTIDCNYTWRAEL